MKKILYWLVFLTSVVRLVSLVILFARGHTHLPAAVLAATSLTVLFGMFLLVRRFIFTLSLKHFVQFFALQSVVFAFNLVLTARVVLLDIDLVERLVVGNLLDILVGIAAIYYCAKAIRRSKYLQTGGLR